MAATRPPHLAPVSVHGTLRMQAEDFLPTPAFEDPDVEPAVVVKVASALAGAALLFVCKHYLAATGHRQLPLLREHHRSLTTARARKGESLVHPP